MSNGKEDLRKSNDNPDDRSAEKPRFSDPFTEADVLNPLPDPPVVQETPFDERRAIVTGIRPINTASDEELNTYLKLLKHKSNRPHFPGVPESVEEMRRVFEDSSVHGYVAVNVLNESVGFGILRDAPPGRFDSYVERLVVENALQNKRGERTPHVGSQFLELLLEEAFTKSMHDGRQRTKLAAGVVMYVPKWERSIKLFKNHGFRGGKILEEQCEVEVDGIMTRTDVLLVELDREQWIARKQMQSLKGPQLPPQVD